MGRQVISGIRVPEESGWTGTPRFRLPSAFAKAVRARLYATAQNALGLAPAPSTAAAAASRQAAGLMKAAAGHLDVRSAAWDASGL